ncbi:MAG: hypothetical protein LBU40_01965 [Methanobrevibacter sp.]|nr:hypothetical protein [Methanobrevibacter sp.]
MRIIAKGILRISVEIVSAKLLYQLAKSGFSLKPLISSIIINNPVLWLCQKLL